MDLNSIFSENGLIAQNLNDFEFRPQQLQMANAVWGAVCSNQHLIVEAGTGVGKSLAYLEPAICWSVENSEKIVISTYTKTLQEQLINKDLPFLQRILDINFRFALCVGGQNYACLRRFHQGHQYDLFETKTELNQATHIASWLEETETGLYSDLDFQPTESIWGKVCREADLCLGKKCAHRRNCFYNRARQEQARADILVVNHHLFFANLISGGKVLPNFDAVVFDEAHTLEDVATQYLGIEVSNLGIKRLLDSIFNPRSKKGFLNRIKSFAPAKAKEIKGAQNQVRQAAQVFFSELVTKFNDASGVFRVQTKNFIVNSLKDPLIELCTSLSSALDDISDDEDRIQLKSYISRARGVIAGLETIVNQEFPDYVYWIEIFNRSHYSRYSLYAAPVDISEQFRLQVLDRIAVIVLTSATLSTNGNFKYIKKSLGIDEASELLLSSPFDYSNNALVYIPRKALPDPSREYQAYQEEAIAQIKEILKVTNGKAFVLFTNYKMLEAANDLLSRDFPEFSILKQGSAPRYKLLSKFRNEKQSVLLGTNTFWQGVDVPGKALECVIITKLPFAVPDDPIIEAKMQLLRAQNKDPFLTYQLPQAIIMFRQGFGRLIRRKTDVGLVAVLDPRIKTRFYGRTFLGALPECRQTSSLDEVSSFFQEKEKEYEERNFASYGNASFK